MASRDCRSALPGDHGETGERGATVNLLLLSIDSLRLDHAPLLGAHADAPSLAARLRGFAAFARCFSTSSATRPAHASLLSGLYPFAHGVRGQRTPAMRRGLADVLTLLAGAGWRVQAFSEAPAVFAGLPFAPLVQQLPADPAAGLARLRAARRCLPPERVALFVHYWSTHTPYGAPDERADGQVGRLLAAGRRRAVEQRYAAAVRATCERKAAPLLGTLDPGRWAIVLCSDHGESWTADEPYHGRSLRNSVLRVPLFVHVPAMPARHDPDRLASLVDVLPTLLPHLGVQWPTPLHGRSLFATDAERVCLAEIEPVKARAGAEASEAQNCVLDARYKLTEFERSGRRILEHTWTELPAADEAGERALLAARDALRAAPPGLWGSESALPAADPLLEQRLRDLGYLSPDDRPG